ncbi:MAG: hypothetical protein WDM85_14255 [Caulobacteraceae bacterium]
MRKAGATPEARYAIVAKIFADPRNALAFVDAHGAAALAKAALAQSGMKVFDAATGCGWPPIRSSTSPGR